MAQAPLVSCLTFLDATSTVQSRASLSVESTTRASSNSFDFLSSASLFGSRATYAMRAPSGDHANDCTALFPLVNFTASPPATGISQIWSFSSRSERKASVFPSGDQRGLCSDLLDAVHCRISRLATSYTQMWRTANRA